jgi:hypothetical protein
MWGQPKNDPVGRAARLPPGAQSTHRHQGSAGPHRVSDAFIDSGAGQPGIGGGLGEIPPCWSGQRPTGHRPNTLQDSVHSGTGRVPGGAVGTSSF